MIAWYLNHPEISYPTNITQCCQRSFSVHAGLVSMGQKEFETCLLLVFTAAIISDLKQPHGAPGLSRSIPWILTPHMVRHRVDSSVGNAKDESRLQS